MRPVCLDNAGLGWKPKVRVDDKAVNLSDEGDDDGFGGGDLQDEDEHDDGLA